MDSQVDEVKNRVDIVGLISEYIPLKKAGRNYKALCPFHGEKTPSFMVNPDRQIFKCFGCGEGGDAFAFLKRMEGMEFAETLRFLANRVGVKLKDYHPSPLEQKKEVYYQISEVAAHLYQFLLTKHPMGKKALEYLKQRGVTSRSIQDFQIGITPSQRNFSVKFLQKKGFSLPDIEEAGLAISTSDGPVDRFKNRIMFPILDVQGKVIAFSGRSLGDQEPKYLNSPETPIFSKSKALYGLNLAKTSIKKEKTAILVEGNLDVISSVQVGVANTVAPLGTAVAPQQIELLKRFAENLVFAFDNDPAGDTAAKRAITLAENQEMNIKVVQLSSGKDPDEVIRKNPSDWKKAISGAVPVYDYFISSAIKKFGIDSAEGKRKAASTVLTDLAQLQDDVLKAHYLQVLAGKIGMEESVLRSALAKLNPSQDQSTQIKKILEKPLTKEAVFLVQRYLLALIIQSGQALQSLDPTLFEDETYQEVAKLLKKAAPEKGSLKIKKITKLFPEALLPILDELLLLEIDSELLETPEKVDSEIHYCLERLKQLNLRKRLRQLSLAIKQAESNSDQDKIRRLSEQFRDLSKALSGTSG